MKREREKEEEVITETDKREWEGDRRDRQKERQIVRMREKERDAKENVFPLVSKICLAMQCKQKPQERLHLSNKEQ